MLKKIINFISGKTSLIYLVSEEEERVEKMVASAAQKAPGGPLHLYIWSCLYGLTRGKESLEKTTDLTAALGTFMRIKEPSLLVCKDLHLFLNGAPQLVRQLKDTARVLRSSRNKIFFVCPYLNLPQELYSIFKIEDVPLPAYEELERILEACIREEPAAESLRQSLDGDIRDKMVRAAMGFTVNEAQDAFHAALMNRTTVTGDAVDIVLEQKQALVRKSGVLEFVSAQAGSWEIGGLVNLKKWL